MGAQNFEDARMTIGRILSAARQEKGESLSDVENSTKIRARFLHALEEDDFGTIPGDIYVQGFIRNYACYLGLDPEPLIQQYKIEYNHPIKLDCRVQTQPLDERKEGWVRRFSMTLVIVACVVGLMYWGASASKKTIDEEMRSRSAANSKTPTSQTNTTAPPKTTPTTKPSGLNLSVTATSDEGCWLSASADGQQVFEGIIQKGQTQQVKANKTITLDIGNAGGVTIKKDGKDIGPLGQKGAVVQKVFTLEGN